MDEILKKAALQELCNFLGYDEGKFYFSLINKEFKTIEHSHSKSYRILKVLYNSGAAFKLINRDSERESTTYTPLPPHFLCNLTNINQEIISYLEKIYTKNYMNLFKNTYLEMSLYYQHNLDLFLIRNFMKDYAIIAAGSSTNFSIAKEYLRPELIKKVKFYCRKDRAKIHDSQLHEVNPEFIGNRRILIIDGKILWEVIRLPQEGSIQSPEKTKFIGYFLSRDLNEGKEQDYIKSIENELKKLLSIT